MPPVAMGHRKRQFEGRGLNRTFRTLAGLAATAMLAACGGPDAEFEIGTAPAADASVTASSQVPLYIPPDYALRPGTTPEAASPRPLPRAGLSTGESRLLALAGAAEANPRIRTLVDQESTTLAVVEPFRIERLVLGVPPEPPPGFAISRTGSRVVADPLSLF